MIPHQFIFSSKINNQSKSCADVISVINVLEKEDIKIKTAHGILLEKYILYKFKQSIKNNQNNTL